MTNSKVLPPPPKAPVGFAPRCAPGSARRTSSIDVDWPDGREGPMHMVGRARDILTLADGADMIHPGRRGVRGASGP